MLLPVLAAVVLHALFVVAFLRKHSWDLGALVCVSPRCAARPPFEAVPRAIGGGYDGQYYYALARAPWRRHRGDIDGPVRHLRLLYPALCWLFSGGRAARLLWIMPAVNVAAAGGIAGIGAWLAARRGMNPWWGFLLPLALGAGLPTLRDLSDPVSTLALVGLLAAWLTRMPAWTLFPWTAAALFGREQNAAVALILLGAALRGRRLGAAAAVGAALALWAGWFGLLRLGYGRWPLLWHDNFAAPLTGLWYCATHVVYPGASQAQALFRVFARTRLLLELGLAGYVLTRARDRVLAAVLLAGVLLALVAGVAIFEDFWSFGRVLVWVPLGLAVWALHERHGWVLLALAPAVLETLAATREGFIG